MAKLVAAILVIAFAVAVLALAGLNPPAHAQFPDWALFARSFALQLVPAEVARFFIEHLFVETLFGVTIVIAAGLKGLLAGVGGEGPRVTAVTPVGV